MSPETKRLRLRAIGERVAQIRRQKGLTVRRVSALMGLASENTLRNIEAGRAWPKLDTAIMLADALGVDLSYVACVPPRDSEVEFVLRYVALPDAARDSVRGLIETLEIASQHNGAQLDKQEAANG